LPLSSGEPAKELEAIAELLAVRGYDILLVARSSDLLEQVAGEIHSTKRNCRWLASTLHGMTPQKRF
jgi:hypothetical protein